MKKTIINSLTVVTLFFATALNAQVGVGVPAENMHPSAELEVKSSTKGFLPPRMTKTERAAIISPAAGLIVFQTDEDVTSPTGLYFFDGTAWRNGMGATGATGPAGKDGKVDFQNFKVSTTGDTLYLTNGNYVIIPGISAAQTKPISGYGADITDADNNTYRTVYIGTQQWMAENLKVTKYNDGSAIPNITDNTQWLNLTTGAWCYFNNDGPNDAIGKLYNWYAVSPTTNNNRNVCPTGWHVPTDAEWTVLTDYLDGESITGGKKVFLFSALPFGIRTSSGYYVNIDVKSGMLYSYWWSSSEVNTDQAWLRRLNYENGNVATNIFTKGDGLSVRCLKD